MSNIIVKLKEIRNQADHIKVAADNTKFIGLLNRLKRIIFKEFGKESHYFSRLNNNVNPTSYLIEDTIHHFQAIIDMIIDDIELSSEQQAQVTQKIHFNNIAKTLTNNTPNIVEIRKIFIVHGHNDTMKQSVARMVEKIRFEAVILHEQPSKGHTIIEKFEEYANVPLAIVLISADDYGYSKSQGADEKKLRARQNVILELGYFIGRLGRKRVFAIHENVPTSNFEFPSDYYGVIYIPFDNFGHWKYELAKEIKVIGYEIDLNNL